MGKNKQSTYDVPTRVFKWAFGIAVATWICILVLGVLGVDLIENSWIGYTFWVGIAAGLMLFVWAVVLRASKREQPISNIEVGIFIGLLAFVVWKLDAIIDVFARYM